MTVGKMSADLYARLQRSLNEKEAITGHGEILNMDDKVGDFFDDRGTSKEVPITSIVLIRRFAPDPTELQNLQDIRRYGSLMPESAARPRKRPLPDALQDRHGSSGILRAGLPNRPEKRQRIQDTERISNPDRPILSREDAVGGYHISQASGTEGSVHQVIDSQRSPGKQRTLPSSRIELTVIQR